MSPYRINPNLSTINLVAILKVRFFLKFSNVKNKKFQIQELCNKVKF